MVVFLMPSWSAPSELWMQRMISALEGRLLAIGCYDAPVGHHATGVPVINLGKRADEPSIARGTEELLSLLHQHPDASVLCHYLPFALRYEHVWANISNPVFVHAHGYDLVPDLQRDGRPFHPPTYRDDVARLSHRAVLLANSQGSATKLRAIGVSPDRVIVKYLGVPVGEYRAPSRLAPDQLNCLFLGRLVDFKGPLETLKAFELACARGLGGRLTFAGDGPLMASLKAAVAQSPAASRVTVLGAVSAGIGDHLRKSHHAFVAHSRLGPESGQDEALGVAYLEAMAAGMPIVSASGGSLPEIVEHDVSGLLSPPGDIEAQANHLLQLSRDQADWSRLSRGAWQRAKDLFSIDRERQQLLDLLALTPTTST